MLKSIRWRLVTSYLLLAAITVATVGVLAMWAAGRYVQQQEIEQLTTNAENIAEQAQALLVQEATSAELDQLAEAASFFGDVRVRILDLNRNVLADSGIPGQEDNFAWFVLPEEDLSEIMTADELAEWIVSPFSPEFIEEILSNSLPRVQILPRAWMRSLPAETAITIIRRTNSPWGNLFSFESRSAQDRQQGDLNNPVEEQVNRSEEFVSFPIESEDQPLGYVELSAGTDYGTQALATTRQALLLAGFGAVILAVVLGLVMGRRLSAPITELTHISEGMSDGDLSLRAEVRGDDEIGALALQFNQMAGQLETSFEQLAAERDALRRFIADASHELRTPITALKNFNELLRGPASNDPQAVTEFLAESQAQIDRLAWITDNLLDLSRLDAGIAALDLGTYDVNDIIQAALQPLQKGAQAKGIVINRHLSDALPEITCDRARLESAVSNLVDNAIKFSPPGSEIEIGSHRSGDSISIWVKDDGPGILAEVQEHIFDRFYRGPDQTQQGSGLGLSIAQSIVNAHGGSVEVDSQPGSGACFTISLPHADSSSG